MAMVPDDDDLGTEPPGDLCQDVLVDLREVREEVLPGPDDVIDETVEEWLSVAESAFFECFRDGDRAAAIDDLRRTLNELEAEVSAALDATAAALDATATTRGPADPTA